MKNIYQVVSQEGTHHYSKEELMAKYEGNGIETRTNIREQLQGQPKLYGLLGPMWNGIDNQGRALIRYETQAVYSSMCI